MRKPPEWNVENFDDDYVRKHIYEAARGETESAKLLLELYRECIDFGKPVPERLQKYLAAALGRVLDRDYSADEALYLTRERKRPSGISADYQQKVAAYYLWLLLNGRAGNKTEAKEAVAARFHRSVREVERAVAANSDLEHLSEAELRALAELP